MCVRPLTFDGTRPTECRQVLLPPVAVLLLADDCSASSRCAIDVRRMPGGAIDRRDVIGRRETPAVA